eukprot:TRINITY_DN9358_c0_g1_i2.p1 TRINITY_DN9358_c0_g1~~TRINITY_DN9358_c0_g1_i2.p1  ORF type:complete len:485 (+),score=97.46 TRINITY_DN9358_c0_g1_i2:135-1457(+)
MAMSRANGGPYTFDELYEDYTYSEICLCTPLRGFIMIVMVAACIFAALYFTGSVLAPAGNNTVVSAEDEFVDILPPALFVREARDDECNAETCQLPDCFCNSITSPPRDLPVARIPQIVTVTFDDAITVNNYEYFQSLFNNRNNPNGCQASATFYVSHIFSNYRLVQNLYKQGHEIAAHTITHGRNLEWNDEIVQQRQIMNRFAQIPSNQILGFRAPFLEPGGDAQLTAMARNGFTHDSSFLLKPRELNESSQFPFTWEFPFDCQPVGQCPSQFSYPELWEVGVNIWTRPDGTGRFGFPDEFRPNTKQEVLDFLRYNYYRQNNDNKAPFGIFLHARWFDDYPFAFTALREFLDEIQQNDDTYLLSHAQMLDWMRTPVTVDNIDQLESWQCDSTPPGPEPCTELEQNNCRYVNPRDGSEVFMATCLPCPDSYPWLDNPLGI